MQADSLSTTISVAVVIVAVLTLFLALVVAELMRQVVDLRARMSLDDRPIPEQLWNAGDLLPSRLTDVLPSDAQAGRTLLVLLTTGCTTCRVVADGLEPVARRLAPEIQTVVVVQAIDDDTATRFIESADLDGVPVVVDTATGESDLPQMRPLALAMESSRLTQAATVRNARQLAVFAAEWSEQREEAAAQI